jgi:hypothetical protein
MTEDGNIKLKLEDCRDLQRNDTFTFNLTDAGVLKKNFYLKISSNYFILLFLGFIVGLLSVGRKS